MVEKFPFKRINFMTNEQYVSNTQEDNELYAVETPCIIEKSDSSLLPSWYRVWSDGWIEQGGISESSVGTSGTIDLLKSFTTTNYTVTTGSNANSAYYFRITGQTMTTIAWAKSNTACAGHWYACGY